MDDSAPLMHVDWIRWLEVLKRRVEAPVTVYAEEILGGQPLTETNDTNVTITLGGTPATALLKAVSLTLGWTGTLAAARLNANVVQAVTNDTNVMGSIAAQTLTLAWTGQLGLTRGGTAASLTAINGGLVYSGAAALAVTAAGTSGQIVKSAGAGAPTWNTPGALTRVDDTNVTLTLGGAASTALVNAASLTLGWTGTLGLSRGGTNANLSATGGASQYLKQASAGAAITVGTIPASDIASGAALTKTDDTNVTLTLGGSPTVALLAATSLTLGWTGTLGVTRGGTGASTFTLGSVVFAGASGVYTQDNANFFWDNTTKRLGIGTTSANSNIHVRSSAAFPTINIEGTTTAGGQLQLTSSTNNWQLYASNGNFRFDVNVTAPTGTKMMLTNNGCIQLGTTALVNTATSSLFLGDGTAPTAGIMPANTGALFVDSFGTSGLFGIDATGIINRLTDAARGRSIAQTAAIASVTTFTLGATDTSFMVSSVVTVTTSTTHNFTVAVDYTDETNTAQTLTLTFSQLAGALVTAITNVTGAGPYNGVPLQIRCKASTAITMKTVGTFTVVTYNVEGRIQQVTG